MSDTKFLKDFFSGAAKDGAPEAASRADEIVTNINNRGLEVKHGNSQEKSILVDRHGQTVSSNEINNMIEALAHEHDLATSELKQNLVDSGHEKGLQTEFTTSYRSKITLGDALPKFRAGIEVKDKFPEHVDKIEQIQALDKTIDNLLGLTYDVGLGKNLNVKSENNTNTEKESPELLAHRMVSAAMKDHCIQNIKSHVFSPIEKLIRQHQRQDLVVKDGKIIDQNSGKEFSKEDLKGMQREVNHASRNIIDQLKEEYGKEALLVERTFNGKTVSTFELFKLEGGEEALKNDFPEHSKEIGQACTLERISSGLIKIDSELLLSANNEHIPQGPEETGASFGNPVVV